MEGNQGTKSFQSASERKLFAAINLLSGKVDCIEKRLNCLVTQKQIAVPIPQQPRDYVLTGTDWQRVADEKFLCEFDYVPIPGSPIQYRFMGLLDYQPNVRNPYRCIGGANYNQCRPLNIIGVMQPYFGQGMPIKSSTKVMIKTRSNICQLGKAGTFDWDVDGGRGDIISFVVLE